MLVIQIHLAQVADDLADLLRIGARRPHPVLRLAHLAGRQHFRGLGDLLSILDTVALASYFFRACHCLLLRPAYSVAKNSVQHFLSAASTSPDRSGLELMLFKRSA